MLCLSCVGLWCQLYEAGPVEIGFGNAEGEEGEEGEEEEGEGKEASDGLIYLEDGIYRPSYIADVYDGSYDEFNPKEVSTHSQMFGVWGGEWEKQP